MPFVNPYNFISLPNDKVQKLSLEDEKYTKGEKLTGKLVCRLVTKTPLIIPDHERKINKSKDEPYDRYPFMKAFADGEELPMIPGSSIRGVVRNVFETLTDSCVRTNDDYYFSSRTGLAKWPGLLRKTEDGWVLLKARRYADPRQLITKYARTGETVLFTGKQGKNSYYVQAEGGALKGYVLKMKPIALGKGKYSAYSVMVQDGENKINVWTQEEFQPFLHNIKMYCEGAAATQAEQYEKRLKQLKVGEMIPVWYEPGTFFLALSQLSRNVYANKPKSFLEKKNLQPCENRSALCEACALFGFVGDGSETGAMGSKVRFSDAWNESANVLGEFRLLPILASPRSSSLEFHLRFPGYTYNADSPGVELAGRKFYWHHSDFDISALRPDENPKMSAIMQYANEGSVFAFDVYFDGITEKQLQQLFTALTLGDNREDGEYCHKFGHAKPLGFGSAKVVVEKTVLRNYREGKYEEKDIPDPASLSLPPELQKMLRFTAAAGQQVDYPRRQPGGPIYEWFSANRPPQNRPAKLEYYCKLPLVSDSNISLPENPKDRTARASGPPQGQAPQPSAAAGKQQRKCVDCGKLHWTTYSGPADRVRCYQCRNK